MERTQKIGIAALTELALNLRWSWHGRTHELGAQLEPDLRALTHERYLPEYTNCRTRSSHKPL
jgi:hypothetical protein